MSVNDGKVTIWLEGFAHSLRQSGPVRNAVKGIRHEDKVDQSCRELCQIVSITHYEIAISYAALVETVARHLEQIAVNINRDDVMRDFGNLLPPHRRAV
jgi:hypothetical protein